MDDRSPGGSLPPAYQPSQPRMPDSGERGAAEAERQAAAESAAPISQQPAATPAPQSAAPGDSARPASATWDDEGLDMTFSATLPQEATHFGEPSPVAPICQWCNTRLPAPDVAKCPSCGVRLQPVEGTPDLPGLTAPAPSSYRPAAPSPTAAPARSAGGVPVPGWPGSSQPATQRPAPPAMPRDLSAYEGLTPEEIEMLSNSSATLRNEISQLNSREALEPPSRDVKQAMLEIEFEADRADPMRIIDPGPLSDRRTFEPPV